MILLCLPPILPRDKSDRLGNSIAKCGASVRVCVCVRDQCTVILTAMHKNTIAHHELKVCSIHKNHHQKLIAVTEERASHTVLSSHRERTITVKHGQVNLPFVIDFN